MPNNSVKTQFKKAIYTRKAVNISLLPSQILFLESVGGNTTRGIDAVIGILSSLAEGVEYDDAKSLRILEQLGTYVTSRSGGDFSHAQLKHEMDASPRQPNKKPKSPRVSAAVKNLPINQMRDTFNALKHTPTTDDLLTLLSPPRSRKNSKSLLTTAEKVSNMRWMSATLREKHPEITPAYIEESLRYVLNTTKVPKSIKDAHDGKDITTAKMIADTLDTDYRDKVRRVLQSDGADSERYKRESQTYAGIRLTGLKKAFKRNEGYGWLFCLRYLDEAQFTDDEITHAYNDATGVSHSNEVSVSVRDVVATAETPEQNTQTPTAVEPTEVIATDAQPAETGEKPLMAQDEWDALMDKMTEAENR